MRRFYLVLIGLILSITAFANKTITIITPVGKNSRLDFGVNWLKKSLEATGYHVTITQNDLIQHSGSTILVGSLKDNIILHALRRDHIHLDSIPGKEGYVIRSINNTIILGGSDSSGTLYGCIELSDQIKKDHALPDHFSITDQPQMVMRGTCIGLQKTTLLPGRGPYEYPITEKNFPWFYNKKLWIKYLNMMVEDRYNSLYLWNGHPFASLIRLKDYPYAVEVDSATFKKNVEMYHFLTTEANKRGIWIIQMFYNIIVSKPFAERHHLKTQDRNRPIIPIIADYTRKSIAAFVEKYPNVGLLVCLGESMRSLSDQVQWFTNTIIPGVKDGLKASGKREEPPIILRGHDTKATVVMKAALPLYKNIYTMEKYTGESLTTYQPRGPWAEVHRELAAMSPVHIDNVHILSNLEPFRWGSPDFIQKAVQAMHDIHHANGLHLYPQASYWDWPYTADKINPRLLEMNRDWIWYKAWGRYAWNGHRDSTKEAIYWTNTLGKKYGCGQYGKDILDAYQSSGRISPILIRRFGITEGNRQTLSLGMFMSQLVSPMRWGQIDLLYNSDGPEGETLQQYAKKEWLHQPHQGETPVWAVNTVIKEGKEAVDAIDEAASHITKDKEEFSRLKNDIYCYNAMANFYAEKVQAALWVLHYQYSKNINDLEKALPHLEASVGWYKKLVSLTKNTYLYANSMQTGQRRVPISGADGKNKTWTELLPYYQQELQNFKKNLALLKTSGKGGEQLLQVQPLTPANVTLSPGLESYTIEAGAEPFTDKKDTIKNVAEELKGLQGIQLSIAQQLNNGTTIHFTNKEPVKVLVGFFNSSDRNYVSAPQLETNAEANDQGQADIEIINAVGIPGFPPVNIHSYYFEPGENTLKLKHGACLILGFIKGNETVKARDAGFKGSQTEATGLDWLFN